MKAVARAGVCLRTAASWHLGVAALLDSRAQTAWRYQRRHGETLPGQALASNSGSTSTMTFSRGAKRRTAKEEAAKTAP